MHPPLGLIEGFYGPRWSARARGRVIRHLAGRGFAFYIYAPKADPWLREHWHVPIPDRVRRELAGVASLCHTQGLRFGVGLSPIGALESFDDVIRQALLQRLRLFDDLGVRDLAIQFDDARTDLPDLALRQAQLVHWVRAHSAAERVILCPSYYSDDAVLDAVFGQRPEAYLETLGGSLDQEIEVFWAGEEICSRQWSPGHLERVTECLRRPPFIWDNYPVNDNQAMSRHLHLRGFTGRPASIGSWCSAHAINPALQPTLSCIPALTLVDSYRQGDAYQYMDSTLSAMVEVLGESLAAQVFADLVMLEDAGLNASSREKHYLRRIYAAWEHPAAREIVAWLDGHFSDGGGPSMT